MCIIVYVSWLWLYIIWSYLNNGANAFPDCLFINPVCANLVYERSTGEEWDNSSRTSCNGRGESLEPSCLSVGYSDKNSPPIMSNHLFERFVVTVICSIFLLKIVALLSRYTVRCSDCILRQESEICKAQWTETQRVTFSTWTELSERKLLTTFTKFVSFYMYIQDIVSMLFLVFNGKSNFLDYLMPNPSF